MTVIPLPKIEQEERSRGLAAPYKEHAREYGIEDDLCNMGQRMIDFISCHMEKYPDQRSFSKSTEWKNFISELMAETNRLNSADPEAGNKVFRVIFLVTDWANSVDRLRKLKRSPNTKQKKIIDVTVVEGLRDKETRLKVHCPDLKIPDYTE